MPCTENIAYCNGTIAISVEITANSAAHLFNAAGEHGMEAIQSSPDCLDSQNIAALVTAGFFLAAHPAVQKAAPTLT